MPSTSITDGKLVVEEPVEGSSVGYRVDGSLWHLYSGPTELSASDRVEVKAVRYGWTESDVIELKP